MMKDGLRLVGLLAALCFGSFDASAGTLAQPGTAAAEDVGGGEPIYVTEETTLQLTDGMILKYVPASANAKVAKETAVYGWPFHCPSSCPGPDLDVEPATATLTDEGLGAYLNLDGVAITIDSQFFDAIDSRRQGIRFNLSNGSPINPCSEGSYWVPILFGGYYCFSPGTIWAWNQYPHGGEPGTWHWRLLVEEELISEVPFEMVPATIEKVSGDGQTGVINEQLRSPVVVRLVDADGSSVNYPKNGRTPEFTFSLKTPGGTSGGSVSPVDTAYPKADGTVALNVTLGSKKGSYSVEVSHLDAGSEKVTFDITAVEHEDPEDNEEEEEDIGDEDPCGENVGDPISLKIGNQFLQETDYAQTGLSSLEFVRIFNSFGSVSRITGNYWSTTFDRFLLRRESRATIGVRRLIDSCCFKPEWATP